MAALNEFDEEIWSINYSEYDPGTKEYSKESLFTTGNGFMGLRGTVPEMQICDDHYPATYIAGLYNETPSTVSGKKITNEDLVNAPNLQCLTVSVDDERIICSQEQLVKLDRNLDLKTGLFTSKAIYRFKTGKQIEIKTQKTVSMADRNLYVMTYEITSLNFSGEITVISEADGDVCNYNVARYRSLNMHHIQVDELKGDQNYARLVSHTSTSEIGIVMESKLTSKIKLDWENEIADKKVIQSTKLNVEKDKPIRLEKLVFVEKTEPGTNPADISGINKLTSFEDIYTKSKAGWLELWEAVDIRIEGDSMSQMLLRLHAYHILISGSPMAAKDLDISITARGLDGEAYRGHIFWDELYIMPFYIMHFPDTAKQLLMYRYRRLGTAIAAAGKAGYDGAMFPWQSGLNGSEQSQLIHLNPMSGKWDPDNSSRQRHVSLAIAYNYILYYTNTQDHEFMIKYGVELLIEIAKFWISIAKYDNDSDRYSITGVMGPDEFHEGYAGAQSGGLKDNAYTNIMVVWFFEELLKILESLPDGDVDRIKSKTSFSFDKQEKMRDMMHKLHLDINEEGIIAQFDGFFDLKDIDLNKYRKEYGDIQRMDRILKAQGHSPDEYKVVKQADTMMAFYNLGKDRIRDILANLGYDMSDDYFDKNLNYYLDITSHGSTLSRVVHAKLLDMAGKKELSWKLYQEALYSDYDDIQGGTTAEGIHTGVMASTLYLTMTMFGGIDIRGDELKLTPSLPRQWQGLEFGFSRKGQAFDLEVRTAGSRIKVSGDSR